MKTNTDSPPESPDPFQAIFQAPFPPEAQGDIATPGQIHQVQMLTLMLNGVMAVLTTKVPAFARNHIATQCLAALLANPTFTPHRNTDGEETADDAYARRAVDYADALVAELERRQGKEGQ